MSFELIPRNLSVRLALWHAAVLILACGVLFILAYTYLSRHFEREDRQALLLKRGVYVRAYESDELTGLEDAINAERDFGKPLLFLIRVVSPPDTTIFLSLPDSLRASETTDLAGLIPAREGYHVVEINTPSGDIPFEIGSYLLDDGNYLQIGQEISARQLLLDQMRTVFLIVFSAALLIALAGGYFVTTRALKPVRDLTRTITSVIASGDLQARVPVHTSRDELTELARLFNTMQDRVEKLVRAMRQSLDTIAHDLRTPVTRLRISAEDALRHDREAQEYREALSTCLEESERITATLNTLIDIAEADSGTLRLSGQETRLRDLINGIVELYAHVAEERGITLTAHVPEDISVVTDAGKLQQVIANLVDNAVKYTPSGGRVEIRAFEDGDNAVVEVRDSGIGIPEKDLPNIWDRLLPGRLRALRKGNGPRAEHSAVVCEGTRRAGTRQIHIGRRNRLHPFDSVAAA